MVNYRLVLENYKTEAATIRVMDRLPHSEKAQFLTYKYTVEFDRTLYLATPIGTSIERQQKEFEELQLQRNRR